MSAMVVRGDAARVPLPDASVDLIVTSPPYFGLRSYTDGGEHYDGQIGSEAAPREYVAALLACTREWMRVLKPSGSLFVNLGDKYSTGNSGQSGLAKLGQSWSGGGHSDGKAKQASKPVPGMPPKSLLGLPWRYALGCVDDLGLTLRAEIIWAKPNGLPESVTDRVRRSHEQVFHFTRQPRYFAAVDEIREDYSERVIERQRYVGRSTAPPRKDRGNRRDGNPAVGIMGFGTGETNPLGKLPGSVWEIPSQPLTVPAHLGVDHFAAFPMELPRRIILGWSPPGICTACGEGRRPVGTATRTFDGEPRDDLPAWADPNAPRRTPNGAGHWRFKTDRRLTGYACACPDVTAPTRPAVVLDPFCGTGTTMLVASAYGRIGIGVDRSADYCRLARWRTTDPAERARALGVAKPPPVLEGQGALFGDVAL